MSVTGRANTIAGRSTTILKEENASFLQVGFGEKRNFCFFVENQSDELSVVERQRWLIVDGNNDKNILCIVDDSISLPTQLQQDSGFIFSEKSGCNNGKIRF